MNSAAAMLEHLKILATDWGLRVVAALAIFVIGRWLAGRLARGLEKMMQRARLDATVVRFARHLVYIGLLIVVILAALNRLGVETTSLVAILGAAGLAIGLALQGSLSNFASGIMLILFKPFRAGDYIEGGGTAGSVEEIQIFTTRLRTPDNKLVIVPNAKLTGDNVTNFTILGTRRIDLVVGVAYREDLSRVKRVLHETLAADSRILPAPAPEVLVLQLADNGVNLAVRPWVKVPDYWAVYGDLLQRIKETFEREGISIPFPQREIVIRQEKP
jgi:small conductance mechanosensitive channel